MGASLSSDVYQYKVDEIFQDIAQCVGIADDIVFFGHNDQDHDATLYSVLDRACDVGMKFNPDKCALKRDSISFYGVTLTPFLPLTDISVTSASAKKCISRR